MQIIKRNLYLKPKNYKYLLISPKNKTKYIFKTKNTKYNRFYIYKTK